ncbi:MAG: hypothetical protein DRH93_19575 [Deltaproteobacteria bacterium]|nr:MAG: hypothetical protein DRH93_19575 [Deltaproteobacteria bacterium]
MKKLLLLWTALLIIPATATALDWVPFTIARHVDTTFTAATFDAAMYDANDRMKYDNHDCTDDVPCSARFYRSGTLGSFGSASDGLDIITTQAELTSVFNVTSHRIKVVDAVDYCAGGYNTSIIGCGRCNATGFILEDWVGGNVYVHEYGHNVMGCGHRNDCSNNIMNAVSIGTNNSVNATECSGFGGSAYTQLCGNVYDGAGGPLTVSNGPYWITCNVTIPVGRTLTIQAGVEIQFHRGLRIKSDGVMNADGTATRIILYSNNEDQNFPTATVDGELIIQNGGELILD